MLTYKLDIYCCAVNSTPFKLNNEKQKNLDLANIQIELENIIYYVKAKINVQL